MFKGLKVLAIILFLVPTISLADELTRNAQRLLNNLGYNAGAVDGAWGKKTRTALEQFYADRNQRFDGKLDEQELALLNSEYAKLFADMPPDRVTNWDQINGTTRTETLDCRGDQKGLVWVRDNPKNQSDWILNNDFGQYTYAKFNVPPLKSCIYRDGMGWEFNSPGKVHNGKIYVPYFSPSMVVGAKAWGNPANLYNTKDLFPVKVGDIEKLDYSIDYSYQFEGRGNIQIALWFMENPNNEPAGRLYLFRPKTEIMIKIANNHIDDIKWSKNCGKTQNKSFRRLPMIETEYGKMPACIQKIPKSDERLQEGADKGMDYTGSIWFNDGLYENLVGRHLRELDLKSIINQLVKNKVTSDAEYLMGIELNTEIWHGKGKFIVHNVNYDLVTR